MNTPASSANENERPMLNLSVILEDSARRLPHKVALIFGDTRLTFAQVNAAANQVAHGLRAHGINPGDKVALSCPNVPYFPIVYFGILKAGAAVVPLSILLKRGEIAYHLQNSDAAAYFCFQDSPGLPMTTEGSAGMEEAPDCEQLVVITADPQAPSPIEGVPTLAQFMHGQPTSFTAFPSQPNDTAVIIYTSGTTGKPKGAELTHANLFLNAMIASERNVADIHEDDVLLTVLPLFHIFAMTVLMNAGLYRGLTNVLLTRFDGHKVLHLMQEHGVTLFAGVPTMYWGLLHTDTRGIDLEGIRARLRLCVSGGASLPVKVLEEFEEKFKVPILEGYGMSEGSPVVTFNQPGKRKPGSIGMPVWGVEVMIADENDQPLGPNQKGQLLYRGHNVMKGYYKNENANREALAGGWMHSGDVAYYDEDGYFYIVDRTKDMIIRGGLNVYPREVEEAMMKHEGVSMVAVIGVPDEAHGEEIKAYVVPKNDALLEPAELIAWTRDRIAAYKYPRHIEIVEALPLSATGKILKKELRRR